MVALGFMTHNTYGTQYIIKPKDTTDFQYHRLQKDCDALDSQIGNYITAQ